MTVPVRYPWALAALWMCSAAMAADVPAPDRWRAHSGDRLEIEGQQYSLWGLRCPPVDTAEGLRAKALLNTFLRGGRVVCEISTEARAICHKEGRDVAAGLIASGLCAALKPDDGFTATRTLSRDTGRYRTGAPISGRPSGCVPTLSGRDLTRRSRAAACDAGAPSSLCKGQTGPRQLGRHIAGSDTFRATGQGAPAFRPFDCR